MKRYLKMILFIILLGSIVSGIFIGMEIWTGPLIKANADNDLKSTILNHSDISYTTAALNNIYEENIEEGQIGDFIFYNHIESGAVSFEFTGGGVWGPIYGIITLESDYETIRSITVLEQEETPGLGGIVASRAYLQNFIGKKMVPELEINIPGSEPNKDNEVDSITGATRTSSAFEIILNNSFTEFVEIISQMES
jgi:Na+-transporting NADH:ubiquinone oxidoreductase subunit C